MSDRGGSGTSTGWRAHPLRTALIVGAVLIGLAATAFLVWALTPYRADQAALDAMSSGGGVTVSVESEGVVFMPDTPSSAGLVLYPGGRVEAEAYAPLARAVAEDGYPVVIRPMPLNLAVFGIGGAARVIEAHPDVDAWAVGGHSLGGAMAAEFAAREPATVSGLVLMAAYPASSDLVDARLSVLTLWGSNDGLVSRDEVENAQLNLPADSVLTEIDGGNHAGFGSYGTQSGDGPSTLPQGEQARLSARAIADLLSDLSE